MLGAVAVLGTALIPAAMPADAGTATCQEQEYQVKLGPAKERIAGTLCVPQGATEIQVLVPGATYNQSYWEYPVDGVSYREAMNRAGYATLNTDRLGAGRSSHPFSATLTGFAAAESLHQVIQALRPRFAKVYLVAHSMGSVNSRIEVAQHNDVDGLILTGISHMINYVAATPTFASLVPVLPTDPLQRARNLDPGYVTTRPGTRATAFHRPARVTPEALAYDEAHRDVASAGEVLTALTEVNPATTLTHRITVPVFLVNGGRDSLFCGQQVLDKVLPIGADCHSTADLKRTEGPYYDHASRVDAYVLPGAGHSMNFAPNAADYYGAVLGWLRGL
ncbi:alpha/beta fold hydrolase [Pseudonocardiaceae bacterium YIM PH 21723]|nr:alpha/beta fold hydrolase [Pseudonocardiaceae bacterium YIM PH 21723]